MHALVMTALPLARLVSGADIRTAVYKALETRMQSSKLQVRRRDNGTLLVGVAEWDRDHHIVVATCLPTDITGHTEDEAAIDPAGSYRMVVVATTALFVDAVPNGSVVQGSTDVLLQNQLAVGDLAKMLPNFLPISLIA